MKQTISPIGSRARSGWIAHDIARDKPSKNLIGSLKGLYSSGEYSDLIISYRGQEYYIYRAIVCTYGKGKFDLLDNNPRLVYIILQYKYSYSNRLEMDGDRTDASKLIVDILVTYIKVYALAEKYMIYRLKAVVLRQFKEVYISTIDDDRGLRDILDKEEVRDIVKGLGALVYDLVIYLRQYSRF
ncbi:hypothetical protein C8A01DRAFT_51630 [Parachaetomium inaequale]|uniref:Uncharacterized protein n=1 Tax=Parachaetomium inaequale TaxID=2588326 RepID=A0AAN6P3Q4_9PEZI|nr:hypothetical protein C8A01DRAFT_51630 [Parachaetomium inaequale]